MDREFNQVTREGYQKIEQQINQLKKDRPAKIKLLADARALGDLSENAEYSSAKRDLRHLESQLRFLTKQLQYSQIYEPSDKDNVEIGKYVTLNFLDEKQQTTYQLVGAPEVDIDHNKISIVSPIGSALLNHTTGDTVTINAPQTKYQVKIISITK